ncbi:MAG: zinc ABC transporter substrate-binding protein [candidate division Zixibacteria bacterium]|nr:zinc ABC transporter substrate-binding protein [candidate division Zixibacteria bacterium]
MSRIPALLGIVIMVALISGCQSAPMESDTIHAAASILPVQFVVERVGGELVDVMVLVGPGQSPATYEPTSKQMAALSKADLYFSIGVPFEKAFMPKLAAGLSGLTIIDTRRGITLKEITDRNVHHDHDHHGVDPHVWLDPRNVAVMAENICQALSTADPEHETTFRRNRDSLLVDLHAVHKRLTEMLAPYKGRTLYVFHPAYGYFADAYGLRQTAVEIEGKEPGPRQLAELISRAKTDSVNVIFVQAQFPVNTAEKIADALGARVVKIDPLAPDYLDNLERIASAVVEAYRHE